MLLPFGLQIIYLKILLVIFIVELSLKLYKENFVMWRKFCAVVLMAALLVSCGCVASADGSAPAEYIFDFTDSKWVSENVVNDEYNDTISYGETPSVLAGNSETSFSYKSTEGGFTRVYGKSYSWAIVRFPAIQDGKYVRLIVRPKSGVSRVQFRWAYDNTKAVNVNFSEQKSDSDGWYTIIHQIQPTGNGTDKANRAWGFLAPGGYLDVKTIEYGEYFESEKDRCPVKSVTICGENAVVDIDEKTATITAERGLDKDSIGILTSADISVETLTGSEKLAPIDGSAKITEEVGAVISSIDYNVTDANGETTVWTFRKVSYRDINFDFSDASWVNSNKGAAFDETKAYLGDKPYFMPGNDETTLTAVTENGETFMRVNAKKYSWLILRFPGMAPGGYARVLVRPSADVKGVQFRWYFDPTCGIVENYDEHKSDKNGWYTFTEKIALTGQSADLSSKTWGLVSSGGYFDIKLAQYSDSFSGEEINAPVKSAKILGKDAFVDFENFTVSVDCENGLTPQTIGTLAEGDIEITANEGVTVKAVANSSATQQTISYVSANFCYDITDADGVTNRWTFKNVSRNGSVFDLTDIHWVKAHMSNDMYQSFNPNKLSADDALLIPTNDDNVTYTELVPVKNGDKSFLRVKLTNSSKYNWVATRLDNLDQSKYVKYMYKSEGSVSPRWTSGSGYGGGVTKYVNAEKGPGAWAVYMGNVGSCNTNQNYDLENKAMALHTNKQNFDLRYVACFDTYEQMVSYDPSVQSATINGIFGEIDPFEHKIIFDKSAGDLNDVKISTYLNASCEKKGKAVTYPSGTVAQKYVVTDYDGAKIVWTVQLGEGETDDDIKISADGSVEFNGALNADIKAASLYKDGSLIGIKETADNKRTFDDPSGTGVYTVKAFAWEQNLKPLASAEVKDVSYGNIVILGDSYSTFEGYIPSENSVWYTKGGHSNTDVTDVEQTWWKILENSNPGNKILLNESSSGTTVCNTGYGGDDYSDRSFITRLDKLINSGYFTKNKVDTLFVFGGTNDSWAGSPVGEIQYSGWTNDDKKKSVPAFCYLLDRIKNASPETNVICIFNTSLTEEITAGYVEACQHYDVDYVSLDTIDKLGGHPNIKGMIQIKEQITER